MALNTLSKSFQRLNICKTQLSCKYYSTRQIKLLTDITPSLLQDGKYLSKLFSQHIVFKQNSIDLQFPIPRNRITLNGIVECPTILKHVIQDPVHNNFEEIDIIPNKIIEIPTYTNIVEKQAARLVVIRRKKIKKHKKKKFNRKNRIAIQTRNRRKQEKKKKKFEAELLAMTLEAEQFNPQKYVEERIELLTRETIPNKWRGEVLPEDVIKTFMEEKQKKKEYKRRLHMYRLKVD